MTSSFSKFEYLRRLQSLKTASIKAHDHKQSSHSIMEQTDSQLLNRILGPQQSQIIHLQQVVKKVKINALVKQFIYKLKRNIVSKKPMEYDMIQKTLTQIKSNQKFLKTVRLNDRLVAIFMILNIFAILFIQTLSAFQGFYSGYQENESRRPSIIIIELICLGTFGIKLVFSFFSSYSVSVVREKYIKYMAKAYLLSWLFLFDFLNFLATLLKIIFPNSSFFGIFCFVVTVLAVPVLSRAFQAIQIVFFKNFRSRQYFELFKIFMFNIFFAQFVSSIMMAVSFWNQEDNWIEKAIDNGNIAPDLDWWQIYIYSMYWAITTLATVGYGDILPANYFQVIFIGLIMLFGTAILSYNLSEIGSVISNLRSIDQRRKQQTVIFKRMVNDEHISQQLQTQIIDYINKSAQVRAQFEIQQRKQFLDNLPQQLKDEFQSEYSLNIFSNIPFFNLLEHQTLVNLSIKIKGSIYYSGESLTSKDGPLPSVMFLKHGKIGLAYYKPGSILNGLILEKRQINRDKDSPYLLNKYLMTADREINYQIIAKNYCFLLILEYEDLKAGLRECKKDNEFYFSLLNRVSSIDEQWDNYECHYCAPRRHTVFMCPKLHFMPYKSLVIQRQIAGRNVEQIRRRTYVRKFYNDRGKSALMYWKEFYQYVELEFSAGYAKKAEHREEAEQVEKDKAMLKVTQEVLRMHCCELSLKYSEQNEFEIDKIHNFEYFFPQSNPVNLNMLSLKLNKRIKIRFPLRN